MIIITGANNGLGLELTKIFLHNNFDVIAISKGKNNLSKISNNHLKIILGDLTKKSTIKKIGNIINKHKYNIDLLINNVAYSCIEDEPYILYNQINQIINTNLISVMNLTNYIINIQGKDNKLHIVNILSSVVFKGNKNSIYTVSKWGLRGYTECINYTYKKENIIASNIVPCSMKTSYWNNKPRNINISSFADPKDVAKDIYIHLNSKNRYNDLILKKEQYYN